MLELVKIPELIVPLGMPVKDCEKAWGYSGDRLLTCLRGLEYDLNNNASYKDAVVPGAKATPKISAGADRSDRQKMPKDHWEQPEGNLGLPQPQGPGQV